MMDNIQNSETVSEVRFSRTYTDMDKGCDVYFHISLEMQKKIRNNSSKFFHVDSKFFSTWGFYGGDYEELRLLGCYAL
jgi:hypothetical protein